MTANDLDLLKKFARENSQDAFTEIVRRHVGLVYSAALRQVRSPPLAEEIAQSVFTDLAREAGKLKPNTILTAWLYTVTRRTALNAMRDESRRRLREQIAVEMNNMNATASDWSEIEPLLDDAMAALDETDRAVILLRYFENKSLREVGEALGASDDAAQKRVSRAVERLREFFSKRNVAIGASGLAVLISANAVQSAPTGLTAAISTASLLSGTAVSTSTVIAATKTIAMTTLQKTIVTATVAVLAGGGIYEARQAAQLREQNRALQQQQLQQERDDATNRQSGSNEMELLKLRGEVTQLQGGANDPTAVAASGWLERVNRLKQWAEQHPAATIPEFQLLTGEDWLNVARGDLKTDNDYRRAMSSLRNAAENKFAIQLQVALGGYLGANGGQFPTALSQLQSFMTPVPDDAILQRWEIAPASTIPWGDPNSPIIIIEKAPVDDLLDTRLAIDASHSWGVNWVEAESHDALQAVRIAFAQANQNVEPSQFTPSGLLPYATTPEQQAAVQKLIEQQQLRTAP
jgi:RNA polymerase sigma factor (sigma-70 family)